MQQFDMNIIPFYPPFGGGIVKEVKKVKKVKENCKDLKHYCWNVITMNLETIYSTQLFKNCPRKVLEDILHCSFYCEPLVTFNACMDWAKEECKRVNIDGSNIENCKEVLGKCFNHIPFESMSSTDFITVLRNHPNILSTDEREDILGEITCKEERKRRDRESPVNKKCRARYMATSEWGRPASP